MAKKKKDYDLAKAFERIEDELISSMMKNLEHHKAEETKEGILWEQWQAKQLYELEQYRKRNASRFGSIFERLNQQIGNLLKQMNGDGMLSQERAILRAIKKGAQLQKASKGMTGEFFKINDRKLNALIEATTNDMQKAETAILRMSNDQYRKIIYDAQVYANSGAGTYEKAVDMATKDFMAAGLTCVEYKNGARHTLSDYADMAIRTASKRAYLQGEGTKRQEWGIHTVIVNKRSDRGPGGVCPKCLPFVGKVFIDDVWSGGQASDGPYPLISTAIDAGLYHPRCRDSHTTYFPGISGPADDTFTKKELKEIEEAEKETAKQQHAELQAKKWQRVAETRLDPEEKEKYEARAEKWKEQAIAFKPATTIEEAQEYAQKFCQESLMGKINHFKGNADYKGISLEHANAINRALTQVFERFPDMEKLAGIKVVHPGSAQGKKAFPSGDDTVFSYNPVAHGIFINKEILKNPEALEKYLQRSQESWDLVMNNMDKLSGKNRALAERYAKAGRDLVSGDTVEGLFTHELGHHVQWTMLDAKTTNSITDRMQEYAPRLSGYATSSKSEYLAESFAAYMKGETDLLDPEYVAYINKYLPPPTSFVAKPEEDDIIKHIKEVLIPSQKTDAIVPRQAIHRQGTKMFMQRASELKAKKEYGPSYVTITDEEILELVNKFKGSGIVKYDKLGKWDKKETIVDNDKVIGIVINNLTGEEAETSVFRIHYSDGGIHIVPDYPSKRRGKGK